MEICAGTSQGAFVVSDGTAKQVLPSPDVRELVRIGERCFAGTGDGLHVSRRWRPHLDLRVEGHHAALLPADVHRSSRALRIDGRERAHRTLELPQENGAQAMLFRSESGGESWRSLCDETHSPSAANFHGLTVDPEVPGGVLVGTETGEVWRVSDRAEWELCGEGMPTVLSLAAMA